MRVLFYAVLLIIYILATPGCSNRNENISKREFPCEIIDTIDIKVMGQRIYLPVKINNQVDWYIFDTGAGTLINEITASSLNLDTIRMMSASDLYGNYAKIPEVIIPKLSMGGNNFFNIKSGVANKVAATRQTCDDSKGIIGNNVFQNKVIRIDIHNKKMMVSNKASAFNLKPSDGIDMQYYKDQKSPVIHLIFPSMKVYEEVIFDTGIENLYYMSLNQYYNLYNKNKLKQLKIEQIVNKKYISEFGAERDTTNFRFIIDSIVMINNKFINVPVTTFSSNYSRVGTQLLGLGVVTIDYKNNRFYFENYSQGSLINCKPERLGIKIRMSGESFIVSKVKNNSVLYKHGIKQGYKILQINDFLLDSMSLCEFALKDWTYEWNRDSVYMVFSNNDQIKEVNIRLN